MKNNYLFVTAAILLLACFVDSLAPAVLAEGDVNFMHNLDFGSRGSDVERLQQILFEEGYLKAEPSGYFGNLTKAALVIWQKDSGISPATGYFGPKSRFKISSAPFSQVLGVSTSSSSTTTASAAPAVPVLQAELSSENPAMGVIISNPDSASARVPVLGIDFTAGTEDVTLSNIKFHKSGTVADNFIWGAYLVRDGLVVGQYTSISQGVIDFSSVDLQIPAGEKQTIWLAIDPARGASAGNKLSFSLFSAKDITMMDASGTALSADGNFPLNGNPLTITSVSSPSLSSLTVLPLPVGTQLIPGNLNNLIAQWNFDIDNDGALLRGLKLSKGGEADAEAFENLKFFVGGKQIATLLGLGDDDEAYFDMRTTPVALRPGSNLVQVYADIIGSPGDSFSIEISRPYDIDINDAAYNVPIAGQAESGTEINIQAGTLVISAI